MVAAILFDLDGTLLDTNALNLSGFEYTFKAAGIEMDRERIVSSFGRTLVEAMKGLGGERAEELTDIYRRYVDEHHDAMVKPVPGAKELLQQLKDMGIKTGVVTAKIRSLAERGLRVTGLAEMIPMLVAMEDTQKHKPDPEPLLLGLKKLGVSAEQALYVGDSPYDMGAAQAAGVKGVAALWGLFPREQLEAQDPYCLCRSLPEVKALIDSL